MTGFFARLCALAAPLFAVFLLLPPAVEAEDAYLGLPDAAGREEVFAYCGACHSMQLVVQQGLTRHGWEEILEWMIDEQGMAQLEVEEEKLVLDYLAEHVNPETQKERLRARGLLGGG